MLDADRHPALCAARRRARELLARLEADCAEVRTDLAAVVTLAIGGSLGRLEASVDSDLDAILVLADDADPVAARRAVEVVESTFARLPLRAAKADGIYRVPVARAALLDPAAIGRIDETPAVFGKRFGLLLDARPVFGHDACRALQADVISWYARDFVEHDPGASWTYLLNDLARYLHAYASWQQFKFDRSADDSWELRQAKFRTSRVLGFAGLLFLLGMSNGWPHKRAWLLERLALTPLERLHHVMVAHDPAAFAVLLDAYEECSALLGDQQVRAALVAGGPDAHLRRGVAPSAAFERIHEASARVLRVVTRFALARQDDWDPRFFERWLF